MSDFRLEVFYPVAKRPSFTKAAAGLLITQPIEHSFYLISLQGKITGLAICFFNLRSTRDNLK